MRPADRVRLNIIMREGDVLADIGRIGNISGPAKIGKRAAGGTHGLTQEIGDLKQRALGDIEAKALMHDVFVRGLMPIRFLPDVSRSYFEPELPEFEARNAWSLHNAFTASAKEMPMPNINSPKPSLTVR